MYSSVKSKCCVNAGKILPVLQTKITIIHFPELLYLWGRFTDLLYTLLKCPNLSQLGSHKQHFATSNWSPEA